MIVMTVLLVIIAAIFTIRIRNIIINHSRNRNLMLVVTVKWGLGFLSGGGLPCRMRAENPVAWVTTDLDSVCLT